MDCNWCESITGNDMELELNDWGVLMWVVYCDRCQEARSGLGNKGQGMQEKCVKCKDTSDQGGWRTAEGKSFFFCQFCDSFLNDHPQISVRDYIGPKFDTWVSKNIQAAHKARKEGRSPWKVLPA